MPALSASKQRKWRIHPHQIDLYLVLLKPTIVFRALVNMASVEYPVASITFDNVTVGAYTDIQPGMTVRIGSATKHSDYGTTFVREDTITSSSIPIGNSSRGHDRPGEVDLVDNAYVEVLDMREIWAEHPNILDDGTILKKYNKTFNPNSPPVANVGADVADFVTSGELHVLFSDAITGAPDDFGSFVTAPNASISSRAWDFVDGTPSSDTTATPGSVAFPPGQRYVSLTVEDSNGETHTAYALVVACEPTGVNAPINNFQLSPIRHTMEGKTAQFKVFDVLDSADYPPGTRVLIFARQRFGWFAKRTGTRTNGSAVITGIDTTDLYEEMPVSGDGVPFGAMIASIDSASQLTLTGAVNGSGGTTFRFRTTQGGLAGPTGRSHMLFSGWLTEEDNEITWSDRGVQRGLTFTAVDAAGRLAQLPGFTQEIRRKAIPTVWYEMAQANIARYVHYLLQWHSNVLSLTDFKWVGEDYNFSILGSDGASLYEQADQRTQAMAARLGCDFFGRLMMAVDPILLDSDERTSTETVDIQNGDWRSLRWKLTQPPRNHWLRGAALLVSDLDAAVANPYPVFAKAPGKAPGQGLGDASQDYQLVKRTDDLWKREGHRYAARENAKKGMWGISLVHGAYCGIDPIRMEWVRLRVNDANKSLRGESFPDGRRFLPSEVTYTFDQQTYSMSQEVAAEEEVVGTQAIDDPQPSSNPNPYGGDVGPIGWDQLLPITLPPVVDIGDFTFNPGILMPLNPKPGTSTERGRLFGATKDGRCWRLTWPGGVVTFEDISPSTDQRAGLGNCLVLRRDAWNYKKYWLEGESGIVYTNDITATTVTWRTTYTLEVATTDTGDYDFSLGSDLNWDATVYYPELPDVFGPSGTFTGSAWESSLGTGFRGVILHKAFASDVQIKTMRIAGVAVAATSFRVAIYYSGTWHEDALIGSLATSAGAFNKTFDLETRGGAIYHSAEAVIFAASASPSTATWSISEIELTADQLPIIPDNEIIIADFQGCINKKDVYYWLSKKVDNGISYVYFNATFNNFKKVIQTKVAKYVVNMCYGFTVSSFNYRKVWVAAGDPADSSAALYYTKDGGANFSKTAALLNEYGGAPWLNFSKSDKSRNLTDADIMWIKGRDGSNHFQFVKGLSGTPVTIFTSASNYLESPLAFGVIARDLDFVRVATRDGDFYKSSNAGTSFSAATDVPTSSYVKSWSQFPADSAFAVACGDLTLAYSTDSGTTWEDLSSDYASFASGEYGAGGTIIISCVPDLSIKYPVPIGGGAA